MSENIRPKVTIYIASYNYDRFIERAIESVYVQTYKDWELIIIDDGSTDNTRNILEKYRNRKNTFIVFQQNRGLNKTSNVALKLARGTYVMRLDADDYLNPHAVQLMVHELDSNERLALIFPDYYYVDEDDNVIGQIRRHDFEKDVSLYDQPAHGACTMIRKRVLEEIGGYDESFQCQDGYDAWLGIIHNYAVKNIDVPLFYYRQHGNNLTRNEERILATRAQIKAKHVERKRGHPPIVLAVIPVRGASTDPRSSPFQMLGNMALIDWTIAAALQSKTLNHVIVSTPDDKLILYIRDKKDQRLSAMKRDLKLAQINTGLEDTLLDVIQKYTINNPKPDAILILNVEAPFRTCIYIDKFIHTMQLFDVDTVHGVRADDGLFFLHNGGGLKIWNADKKFGLERDTIYRMVGGTTLVKTEYLEKKKDILGGRIGHVLFDHKAAHTIKSEHDLIIAKYLAINSNRIQL